MLEDVKNNKEMTNPYRVNYNIRGGDMIHFAHSINNLFDLVPSRITLSQAKIMEDGLILYGVTPNKDVYNFMLQAPLRSIFHRSYSSFYPVDNGWFRFVSTNYIDEESDSEYK